MKRPSLQSLRTAKKKKTDHSSHSERLQQDHNNIPNIPPYDPLLVLRDTSQLPSTKSELLESPKSDRVPRKNSDEMNSNPLL